MLSCYDIFVELELGSNHLLFLECTGIFNPFLNLMKFVSSARAFLSAMLCPESGVV
jgi:hypothetical protein